MKLTRAAVRKYALPTVLVTLTATWLVCPDWPDPGKDGPAVVPNPPPAPVVPVPAPAPIQGSSESDV